MRARRDDGRGAFRDGDAVAACAGDDSRCLVVCWDEEATDSRDLG